MLPIGSTIGILGGGQLGRMLSVAASRLGFKCHIFEPSKNPPAGETSARLTTACYEDIEALKGFAKSVDVVTFEFENVPVEALDVIESIVRISPNRRALRISQDRLFEKEFLNSLDLKTAPYHKVEDSSDIKNALTMFQLPSILKTRKFGYDGKGQIKIDSEKKAAEVIKNFSKSEYILEGLINFSKEISVIAARNSDGQIACFDPGENIHTDGVLDTTTVPSKLPRHIITDAILLTSKILEELNYIGVLGVELFVLDNELIVNEIAPRVHNSGHWTQNGCVIDQFEQHIRAISGWPLGDGRRYMNVIMKNLLGNDILDVSNLIKESKAAIHLYGKEEIKPKRKMGHINHLSEKS
jgi:5-(carboxyamino)imidazole ribonucleotide synthase